MFCLLLFIRLEKCSLQRFQNTNISHTSQEIAVPKKIECVDQVQMEIQVEQPNTIAQFVDVFVQVDFQIENNHKDDLQKPLKNIHSKHNAIFP